VVVKAAKEGSCSVRRLQNVIYHVVVQATPRLREHLCRRNTCDENGVPVIKPDPAAFKPN
jgi:alkaline phosphatase